MKFRIPFMCVLGVTAVTLALPSYARGIRVDGVMTCSSVVPSTGTLSINLLDTAKENHASAGLNFLVLACASSKKTDKNLTPLAFNTTESVLYTWVDLSSANGTPSSLGLVGAGQGLSGFGDLEVAIVAMVDVLKLTGTYSGDHEIQINYETFPQVACDNVFKPIAPSFTWFGHTYVFTGGDGVSSACDAANTNDFLFGSSGQLLGYNSAPDGSDTFVLTAGLPPGWTVQ